jgi:hypothetical protein
MKRKDTGKPTRPRPAGDYADPYQKARRPRPPASADAPLRARRPPAAGGETPAPFERRGPRREPGFGSRETRGREGGGFTVTLDPDVARVFRGDASVNKALRLVMQLMQVVQGPPRGFGPRAERTGGPPRGGGYQGSADARGFSRKPRFEADDDEQ